MRVLMVTPGYGGVTGVGTACRGLTEQLVESGHVVDVLHIAPGRTSAVTLVDHAGNHRRPRPLDAVLRWDRSYDVVHFHDDASSDGRDGGFRAIVERHPAPTVVTLHSVAHSHQAAIDSSRWRTAAQKAIQADLIHRAAAVITLTPQTRDSLAIRFPAEAEKIHVVGNGVGAPGSRRRHEPSRPLDLRREMEWPADDRIILYLGRLSREKGIVALARAFVATHDQAPDTRLVLAGPVVDASARQALDVLADAGLEEGGAFHLMGAIHPRDREALLHEADLVVLPSLVEQHPMVPLEAMAAGRPVVVSALPHLTDLYALDDRARRLAHPISLPVSAEAIRTALLDALDSPDRADMVRRARQAVDERFGWARAARHTLDVYGRAVASHRHPQRRLTSLLPRVRTLWQAAAAPGSGATEADLIEVGLVRLNLERAALLRGDADGSDDGVRAATRSLWRARPRGPDHGAEVAVVIPVHVHEGNPERLAFLSSALDSVFAQDLAHPMAVVVVDDGSTVDVEPALERGPSRGDAPVRIELIRLPRRTGHPGLARLEGYRWAVRTRTPYVAHLDSDDVMLPHRLRVTRDHLKANPAVVVAHAAHRSIDGAGHVLDGDNALDRWYAKWRTEVFGLNPGDPAARGHHRRHEARDIASLQTDNFVHNATVLIRSSALLRTGLENLAPTVVPGHEDHELWRRLCRLGPIDYLNDIVAEYRQHPESLSYPKDPQE